MNYQQSVDYIESLSPTLLDPSLDRFAAFMQEQGNLQNTYPTIHVTGTNGKGSVVAIVESVLRASGMKTGRFTGPHLLRFNERFHVDGLPIPDDLMAALASRIKKLSEDFGQRHPAYGSLTWFEFLTAIAFFYFAESKVDCAVIEVGLGGKWDATNVIEQPLVSVIVNVSLDHTHILGNTTQEIAREKAGIIKNAVPVITASSGDALDEIKLVANRNESPLLICRSVKPLKIIEFIPPADQGKASPFEAMLEHKLSSVMDDLALSGAYQRENATLAALVLAVCQERLNHPLLDAFAAGFAQVFWPGRFQYIEDKSLLLDGAHNLDGIRVLRTALNESFPEKSLHFVLSFYQNKDVPAILASLLRQGDVVYASQAKGSRPVFPANEIVACCDSLGCQASVFSNIEDAFAAALAKREGDYLVVGTGSFATVKAGLTYLGFATVEDSQPLRKRSVRNR